MTVEERDLGGPSALGERIKQQRLEKRLTAVTAGKAAGISREYWSYFESGRRRDGNPFKPEPSTILAVAKVVDISGAEALRVYGHDPSFYQDGLEGRPRVSQQVALAKVKQLSPEDLAILEPLVDRLLRAGGHLPPEEPAEADQPAVGESASRSHPEDFVLREGPAKDFVIREKTVGPWTDEDRDPKSQEPRSSSPRS